MLNSIFAKALALTLLSLTASGSMAWAQQPKSGRIPVSSEIHVRAKATPSFELVDEKDVPGDVYPGLPMGLLSQKERKILVRVGQAQLCPCPGSAESMDSCLRKKASQCDMALMAAMEGMRQIDAGLGERDVLDAVGQFIEAAFKVYHFDLSQTPHVGNPSAPVVVIEFADFECPYCSRARSVFKDLRAQFGDKVVCYFKQFPLNGHAHSSLAAAAVMAAHKQGKFWLLYEQLFDNQASLSPAKIDSLAKKVGLDMERFAADLKSKAVTDQVEADKKEGLDASVNATPSFFINGRKHLGEGTSESIAAAVAAELKHKR